jgi:drug/metabolite transporter (DMT)-like permease
MQQPAIAPETPSHSSRPPQSQAAGYAAVILAAATWGTSGIFVKYITQYTGITALALAFWRDLSTAIVLMLALAWLRPAALRIERRRMLPLVGLGMSLAAFHVLWNLCVTLFGAAVATVQQSMMPVIVMLAAWFLWREPLTWRKGVGVLLAFAGIVLVTQPGGSGGAPLTALAWFAALGLPVAYAAWNLFGKSVRRHYDSVTAFAYGFAFAALALAPLQLLTEQPAAIPPISWVWFAGLICQTILAFLTYAYGLGRLPASIASLLAMIEIVFVAFYAYVLLGERLSPLQWAGVLLVVGGVLLPTVARGKAAR